MLLNDSISLNSSITIIIWNILSILTMIRKLINKVIMKGDIFMLTNITADKVTNTVDYRATNSTQKVGNKNNMNSDAEKNEVITQSLGNDTFVKSTENDTINSTYKPVKKKLTTEEVKALKDEQESIKADLIKKFISNTIKNQNKILGKSTETEDIGISQESKDLLTKIFGSLEKAYPPIETSPEGAQKAIVEGGAYSVNAVADRIMTMATAIAGDNQDKLQQMRSAVEKGFAQAGLEFKNATNSDLPQISKDTMGEVMSRFDKLQNKNTQ